MFDKSSELFIAPLVSPDFSKSRRKTSKKCLRLTLILYNLIAVLVHRLDDILEHIVGVLECCRKVRAGVGVLAR